MLHKDNCPGCGDKKIVYYNAREPHFGMWCGKCRIAWARDDQSAVWRAEGQASEVGREFEKITALSTG